MSADRSRAIDGTSNDSEGAEPMDWIRVDSSGCNGTAGWIVTAGRHGIRCPVERTCATTICARDRLAASAHELCAERCCAEFTDSQCPFIPLIGMSVECNNL